VSLPLGCPFTLVWSELLTIWPRLVEFLTGAYSAYFALAILHVPRQVAAPRARAVNSPVYKRRCNPIEEKQEKDMNITVHGLHKNDAEAE
jgi:hypothetical protein